MASLNNIHVIMDIEPIVKLRCLNVTCRFNLAYVSTDGWFACALKALDIGKDGVCQQMEPMEKKS